MIALRPATIQDADRLLQWRNDLQTREASQNTTKVQGDEHITWLTKSLDNPARMLMIAEKDGEPVGTVRADLEEGVWELSWTVAPNARGQGVGKQMVSLFASQISEPVRAEVKVKNRASHRVAECAGMVIDRETNGVLHYWRAGLS